MDKFIFITVLIAVIFMSIGIILANIFCNPAFIVLAIIVYIPILFIGCSFDF